MVRKPTGSSNLHRRRFLALNAYTVAATWLGSTVSAASRQIRPDFERLVPALKGLDPSWIAGLTAHSEPLRATWPESKWIGMPVGGICAGQLYLSGDGRLWLWDITNEHRPTATESYRSPKEPRSPVRQGFAIRLLDEPPHLRPLDHTGWETVEFTGEYPIAQVVYRDGASPLEVRLEAFSPFVPLNAMDSALPATVLRFTVVNRGSKPVRFEFAGWLENMVRRRSGLGRDEVRVNRVVTTEWGHCLLGGVSERPAGAAQAERPDIVFEDFERETYAPWHVEGTAFGQGPVRQADVPPYMGLLGIHGERAVNSHAAGSGSVAERDRATGVLLSPPFRIERHYIRLRIGGGAHTGRTCAELLVDGQVVRSATGRNVNRMEPVVWDVREWAGREARIRIVDRASEGWGQIGVDHIVFTDAGPTPAEMARRPDHGSVALALIGGADRSAAKVAGELPAAAFDAGGTAEAVSIVEPLVGALVRRFELPPGDRQEIVAVLAWYFPHLEEVPAFGSLATSRRRWYASRFRDAAEVAAHVATRLEELTGLTRSWRDTWYDTTLPRWLMDRIGATVCNLATNTCIWFDDGRFYAWEGVGCCAGTCTHVWQYAQAVSRLFPELERSAREIADFGHGWDPTTGAIWFRGEHHRGWAVDGQAGTILRVLREHRMSVDDTFLRRLWPRVRRAIEFLIGQDGDGDGLLAGRQHNTLDEDWFGPVAWLSGMYLAALRAAEAMARIVGDAATAERYRALAERGSETLVRELFDGEYFINIPDPAHPTAVNSGTGCLIDQVYGQCWAWQLGLPRVIPQRETLSALRAIWRYNFVPDVGPWRRANPDGRYFAMDGEAGVVMCTFPREDWDFQRAKGGPDRPASHAQYFNECWTGSEYQLAAHMIFEGLVTEGLAIVRAVHDRYAPAKRNPYNEIECGDHYARALASWAVLLALSGFEHDGPAGLLGFAPRLTPDSFRAPFTAAGGWGTYEQRRENGRWRARITVRYGRLRLSELRLSPPRRAPVEVRLAGRAVVTQSSAMPDGRLALRWVEPLEVGPDGPLEVEIAG
ncbi:MAG: non-lysosomal glucosylceramidase [Kiritimatiellae bacterium]|nr:non-lysosomal glucosylceramidase [Kiritimatiellia bacterium]